MEKAIEERAEVIKTKREERWNAKKERYDGRNKRRNWEDNNEDSELAKKQRMELAAGEEKVKRRKAMILLSYSGVNYSGMQRNPGCATIEEELLKAMLKNKWINQLGYDAPQQLLFQRAARTDKGVSAMRQIVSVKIRK
jgi:tRNA pseudouridine38-40 synthase